MHLYVFRYENKRKFVVFFVSSRHESFFVFHMNGRVIGSRIRAARRQRGLTQAALAERAGLSPETVSAIERGKHVPRADTVIALARALSCPPEDLLAAQLPMLPDSPDPQPVFSRRREAQIARLLATARRLDDRRLDLACRLIAVLAETP